MLDGNDEDLADDDGEVDLEDVLVPLDVVRRGELLVLLASILGDVLLSVTGLAELFVRVARFTDTAGAARFFSATCGLPALALVPGVVGGPPLLIELPELLRRVTRLLCFFSALVFAGLRDVDPVGVLLRALVGVLARGFEEIGFLSTPTFGVLGATFGEPVIDFVEVLAG